MYGQVERDLQPWRALLDGGRRGEIEEWELSIKSPSLGSPCCPGQKEVAHRYKMW
jgi:hypothetical protein